MNSSNMCKIFLFKLTPASRINGVTTAPVEATGDSIPTLSELGSYNVNMPFLPEDGRSNTNQNGSDYDGSKSIRLAQPSGGMSGGEPYGIHFSFKRSAEMVLAYVDGNEPVMNNVALTTRARDYRCRAAGAG